MQALLPSRAKLASNFYRSHISMKPLGMGGLGYDPMGKLMQCLGRAPTGQLQESPGQRPGNSIAQRKSPEGARHRGIIGVNQCRPSTPYSPTSGRVHRSNHSHQLVPSFPIGIGTPVARRPSHGSRRAVFPHGALHNNSLTHGNSRSAHRRGSLPPLLARSWRRCSTNLVPRPSP